MSIIIFQIAVGLLALGLTALVASRIVDALLRKDYPAKGETPVFFQPKDPYIESIMTRLNEAKAGVGGDK